MINASNLKHDYRQNNRKNVIKFEMFSKTTCLIGIRYECCKMCDGITHDKQIVINDYHTLSFGLFFFNINFTWWL
jgi:hypothetical protein